MNNIRTRTIVRTRKLFVPMLALACAGTLAACGGSSVGTSKNGVTTITVTMWDSAEATGAPTTEAIINKFNQSHPKIKAQLKSIPFTDFEQKMLLQIQSRQTPDVIETYGNYTADFAAANALSPLDKLAGSDYLGQVPKPIADTGKIDGKFVAAPWAIQPVGLWYNKTLLSKAGVDVAQATTSMDNFIAALKKIKSTTPSVIPMGIDSTTRVFGLDVNWPWMKTFGATPIDNGSANAGSDGMKKYLDFMQTLGRQGLTEINQKIGYFRPLAAQNKVAFIADQSILESVIKATDKNLTAAQFDATWGVSTLPTGADGKSYSVPQDHQLAVMQASKNKDAAWQFVEWMTRSQDANEHVIKNKSAFPSATNLSGQSATLLTNDKSLQTFKTAVTPTVVTPPWGPKYAKAYEPIMVGVQQVMTSTRSPGSIADEMQSSLKTVLQ